VAFSVDREASVGISRLEDSSMNRAQEKFGEPLSFVRKKIEPQLNAMVQDFIRQSPFAVLSTSNVAGECDASPKGGRPGFVKVIDEGHLLVPDIAGNKLFQSYENVEGNPNVGLLFLIPGCDWTVRVNGGASVVEKMEAGLEGVEAEVFAPDENSRILQGLRVTVREAYAHCPRAFTFSRLWDTESIQSARDAKANRYWLDRWREGLKEPMEI
jgi:predicted pyridoxine 5'-phosphate oxidase superfamily flavin-nucleotide-binding protein